MKKFPKFISVLSLLMMLTYVTQAKSVEVGLIFGDDWIQLEEGNIFVQEGITYIPLREVGELFDARIHWESINQTIQIEDDGKQVIINTQDNTYSSRKQKEGRVEEEIGKLNIVSKDGRTYLPLRLFANLFEHPIHYLSEGPFVRIETPQMILTDEQVVQEYQPSIEQLQKETIYLTFDDGPNEYTEEILDLLLENDMQATFFVLEKGMKDYPQLVQRMIEEGHTVGLHGVTHRKDLFYEGTYAPYNEIEQNNQTLEDIAGIRSYVIRMPYGSVPYLTDHQFSVLLENDYEVWDWHIDPRDWENKNGTVTYQEIIKQLEKTKAEAPIVLLHDSEHTVDAVDYLMDWMNLHNKTSKPLTEDMDGRSFKEANMH